MADKPLTNRERIRLLTQAAEEKKKKEQNHLAGEGGQEKSTPPTPNVNKTPPSPAGGPTSSRIESSSKKGNPPSGKKISPPSPLPAPAKGDEGKGSPPPKKKKKKQWGGGLERWECGRLPHGSTFTIEPWDGVKMLWRGTLWIPKHVDEKSGKEFEEVTFHAEFGGVFPLLRGLDRQYRRMIQQETEETPPAEEKQ